MIDAAQELIQAYHVLSYLKMDDHTYTHLSHRTDKQSSFYLPIFGMRFEEVDHHNLLEIDIAHKSVVSGQDSCVNITAYALHADTYAARQDCQAILHLHTPEIVAVSAQPEGLLPISQWALHFYEKISYYNYDSLLLEPEQSHSFLEALGRHNVLLMRHHGVLICGKTMAEAVYYAYHLQQACRTQCLALSAQNQLLKVSHRLAQRSAQDLLAFEKDLGQRDWAAWKRLLQRQKSSSSLAC